MKIPVLALLLLGSFCQIANPAPQPTMPILHLTGFDGRVTQSDRLGLKGQWLIIYIQPNCRACDSILQIIKKEHPNLAPRTMVIGAMPVADLKRASQKCPHLASSKWYADPGKQVIKQLRLPGAPVVLGIRQNTVVWKMNGLLPNTKLVQKALANWTK